MLKGTSAKLAGCPREGRGGLVTSSLGFGRWNKVLVSDKYKRSAAETVVFSARIRSCRGGHSAGKMVGGEVEGGMGIF